MYYVYLLISLKNNKTYIGLTSKYPKTRVKEHNSGSNDFTRNNKPWKLIYYETFTCRKCADKMERFLKSGLGNKLVKLIINNY